MIGAPLAGEAPSSDVVVVVVLMALPAQYRAGVASIFGQDLVDLLPGPLDRFDAPVELGPFTGPGELLGRHHQLSDPLTERADPVVELVAQAEPERGSLRLGSSRVGQAVRAAAVDLRRAHQALVLEQLEVWVDRAGAGRPQVTAHFFEPPDD